MILGLLQNWLGLIAAYGRRNNHGPAFSGPVLLASTWYNVIVDCMIDLAVQADDYSTACLLRVWMEQ